MTEQFKPLLAVAMQEPKFPYLASPKLDGIRCIIRDGVAYSRNLKPIPNKHIQSILGNHKLSGLDGEIIVGSPTDEKVFSKTTSVVMSHDKVEDFMFHVFDDITDKSKPFTDRISTVIERHYNIVCDLKDHITVVPHEVVETQEHLDEFEEQTVTSGYEGVMLRDPLGIYKCGRSTVKQNILLKVKRFEDSEAEVIGFEELMHNDNPAETSELGHSKRATKQENLRPSGILGALVVRDLNSGVEFNIGTGLSKAEREEIWNSKDEYLGLIAKYKYFPVGVKDKPRHPVFLGWRSQEDL